MTPFKGASKGDIIYFGPFASYGIGNEYLAFLKRTNLLVGDLKRDRSEEQPGARGWRRYLSENAHRREAGVEVIGAALEKLPRAA